MANGEAVSSGEMSDTECDSQEWEIAKVAHFQNKVRRGYHLTALR